jgi:hypothetical protein
MRYEATVRFYFEADTARQARALLAIILAGGIGETSALFSIVSVRPESPPPPRNVWPVKP